MKGRTTYLVIGMIGAIAATIPFTVYHFLETTGAEDQMTRTMACHAANWAATAIGLAIAAIVAILPFSKNISNAMVSLLLLAAGAALSIVPRIVNLCGSLQMARYFTLPTLTVLGFVIMLLSLVLLARQLFSKRKGATCE